MATKRPDENPTIADTIILDITTENDQRCLVAPHKVISVVVYFIQRDFSAGTSSKYTKSVYNPAQLEAYEVARSAYCENPTQENLAEMNRQWSIVENNAQTSDTYFSSALAVASTGDSEFPAYTAGDPETLLKPYRPVLGTDLAGRPIYGDPVPGHFTLEWEPSGAAREGDYFVCWSYMLNPAGATYSRHFPFSLLGSTQTTTAIPTHFTDPEKYTTLLDRYLPEVFRMRLVPSDLTPDVLENLHGAVAQGFNTIEDQVNQIIDLLDANAVHESIIPYLSNLFALRLRTHDATLWRRQIKRAVPLHKRKGTIGGLEEALAQAGVKLLKHTRLYQVISNFTFIDSFLVEPDVHGDLPAEFPLTYSPSAVDLNNFELVYRAFGKTERDLTSQYTDYIDFVYDERGNPLLSWRGDGAPDPITLAAGDLLRVMYTRQPVGLANQARENQVRSLPLADQRDEVFPDGTRVVPLKNWNVRVIAEDDVLLPLLAPSLDAFHDPVLFGHIRTEFPYSENAYNMDEYNGSTRESTVPCDIDRDFLDPCSGCLSSKFVLDLEVEDLCDDRVKEVTDVIREFVPFHAVIHNLNFMGAVNEYCLSPVETVEVIVSYNAKETVVSGNANVAFTRYRSSERGDPTMTTEDPAVFVQPVLRNMLSHGTQVVPTQAGMAFNSGVALYAPGWRMDALGIAASNVVEVFDGPNQGEYRLGAVDGASAQVIGAPEPLDQSQFTFRLSNKKYELAGTRVFQSDLFLLSDPLLNYGQLGVLDETDQAPWSVQVTVFSAGPPPHAGLHLFPVHRLLPDGRICLQDPNGLLSPGITTYVLFDGQGQQVGGINTGTTERQRRGLVQFSGGFPGDVREHVLLGEYIWIHNQQYLVSGYVEGNANEVYINGYDQGTMGLTTVRVYKRLLDNAIGSFGYHGLWMDGFADLETNLAVQDGENGLDPSTWVEGSAGDPTFRGHLLFNVAGEYYTATWIDHNRVGLAGPARDWGTEDAGGTKVSYSVLRFDPTVTNLTGGPGGLNIDGTPFPFLDRRGQDVVETEVILRPMPQLPLAALAATLGEARDPSDLMSQDEGVSLTIEYANGQTTKGEL